MSITCLLSDGVEYAVAFRNAIIMGFAAVPLNVKLPMISIQRDIYWAYPGPGCS